MKRISAKQDSNILEARHGESAWMLTFLDMLMVLLSFFILRFSMTTVTRQNFEDRISKLRLAATDSRPPKRPREPLPGQSTLDAKTAALLGSVSDALSEALGYPSVETEARAYQFRGGIMITIQNPAIMVELGSSAFVSDSDEITFIAQEALGALGRTIKGQEVRVEVSGHTDKTAFNGKVFPSNWELSTARAVAAARQIIDAGVDAQSISVIGYADSKVISDSHSRAGRHRNRRIELRILPRFETVINDSLAPSN